MGRDALILEAVYYLICNKYNEKTDIDVYLLDLLHRLKKEVDKDN
jgi:hypothetical protein